MTNLEAKQEAIKKAYGEYWEEVRRCIDEKGWCSFNLKTYFKEDLIDSKVYRDKLIYRPKSLQGIENNNGWIRIESEEDLPKKEFNNMWIKHNDGDILIMQCSNTYLLKNCTHYQPIEKPNTPIY